MKRFGQVCPVARALDVVGDRWALLIVRDLLLGPQRFTDLQRGLRGIGTNVLTSRLAELQDCGVVAKTTLGPPAPAIVYELTDAGRALGPTLSALRAWGAEHAPGAHAGDDVRSEWILVGATARRPHVKKAMECELHIDDEAFVLYESDGVLAVRRGTTDEPHSTIALDTTAFLRLAIGDHDPRAVMKNASVEGDRVLARQVLEAVHDTVTAPPS